MENHYQILGVPRGATTAEIKKAFRERAKKNHPDVATGVSPEAAQEEMRKLIAAYEILTNSERRYEYDRAYGRFVHPSEFNYKSFLWERRNEPEYGAKLIFYDFLHLEEDEALLIWQDLGSLDFTLDRYLDREDWMDCTFILAEELYKRDRAYESFILLVDLVREEDQKPYFRHFMGEIHRLLKELVRLKLPRVVDDETLVECLEELLDLGYSRKEEGRWLKTMAEALSRMGDRLGSEAALREALRRDPSLPKVAQMRRKLGV